MTVGQLDHEGGEDRELGYRIGAYGSLDDDTFDYDGDTYTVRQLRTSSTIFVR